VVSCLCSRGTSSLKFRGQWHTHTHHFLRAKTYQSHFRKLRYTHTHCQVPHTLSNLKQPRGKRAAVEEGRKPNKFFRSSLFQEKEERGSIASRNCSSPGVILCVYAHTHKYTLTAPLCALKTSINAQRMSYSSENEQPKAFQGRQLGRKARVLKRKLCRLQLKRWAAESLRYTSSSRQWHEGPHANSKGTSDAQKRKPHVDLLKPCHPIPNSEYCILKSSEDHLLQLIRFPSASKMTRQETPDRPVSCLCARLR